MESMRKQLGIARAVPKENSELKRKERKVTGYSGKNNLNPEFIASPGSQERESNSRKSRGIRRNAESRHNAKVLCPRRRSGTVEVGDGHISALKDGENNISSPERRAVSLNKPVAGHEGQRMNVEKTGEHPGIWVKEFCDKLYMSAKISPTRRFGMLYDKVCRYDVLQAAWKHVRKKKGKAPGVDKETVENVEAETGVENFLSQIQTELRSESYSASAIRRVYIPKGENSYRPLGIPVLKDKVIQMAVKIVIEPLFEAGFCDCSYGFRPGRSNSEAARLVHKTVNRNKWIVDVDLKSYFDNIPHEKLMELISHRVRDGKVRKLIRQWLKAGIMEEGKSTIPDRGSPQGGVLSPLLSNIYLHEIDRQWDGNATVKLVRFADDMVFLCKSKRQAKWVLEGLKDQLHDLDLTLNPEKTKVCHVKEGFDFLGFTYKETMSRRSKYKVRVKYPKKKSLKSIRDRIKTVLKNLELGTNLKKTIDIINRKIRGWTQYYKIGNSYEAAEKLAAYVCRQLRIYWRRCKHRKDIQGTGKWKNKFFYEKGLLYAPKLLRKENKC